ncbi:MAG: arylsulfatase [Candidatus Hydrogenedentes bacterium]|nr:arylsulfatase [Candidatus Hydrogenedentota bacterium]
MPITPRPFLLALALALFALAAWRATAQPREADTSKKTRPNIIFILADDLGYGDLGVFGQEKIKTPHLDRLAAEGTRFTSAYAGHAVCAPSRSVLMTGQHTGHTRIRNNSGQNAPKHDGQEGRIPLHAEDYTVAQLLKEAGYRTGIAGKWGLGEPGSTGLPNDHGFDEWLGYLNQDHAPDYYTDFLWHNKEKQPIPENANGARVKYSCDLFADFAEAFIRREAGNPFFLYLPFTTPHAKIEVPDLGEYANANWSEEEKILAAMITRLDGYVGRITSLLKELGIDENTIILFASDNGASGSSHEFFQRSGPLRAKKGALYEGGIRTPAIVRWPGKVPAGAVSEVPWYFADFLPTAGALAGVRPPQNIDGVNVLPTLLGGVQPSLQSRFLYWETHEGGALAQAVRWGQWKAVRYGIQEPLELYNLNEDVEETKNVAADHADVVTRIEKYLETARTDSSPYYPTDLTKRQVNRYDSLSATGERNP